MARIGEMQRVSNRFLLVNLRRWKWFNGFEHYSLETCRVVRTRRVCLPFGVDRGRHSDSNESSAVARARTWRSVCLSLRLVERVKRNRLSGITVLAGASEDCRGRNVSRNKTVKVIMMNTIT